MTLLDESFGINPTTCGHRLMAGSTVYLVTPDDEEDWVWALGLADQPRPITSVRLCWLCQPNRPSELTKLARRLERAAEQCPYTAPRGMRPRRVGCIYKIHHIGDCSFTELPE